MSVRSRLITLAILTKYSSKCHSFLKLASVRRIPHNVADCWAHWKMLLSIEKVTGANTARSTDTHVHASCHQTILPQHVVHFLPHHHNGNVLHCACMTVLPLRSNHRVFSLLVDWSDTLQNKLARQHYRCIKAFLTCHVLRNLR